MRFRKRVHSGRSNPIRGLEKLPWAKDWTKTWGIRNRQWVAGASGKGYSYPCVGRSTLKRKEKLRADRALNWRVFAYPEHVLKALRCHDQILIYTSKIYEWWWPRKISLLGRGRGSLGKEKKKNQEICHASTGRSRLEHIMVVGFLTVRSWTWVLYNHEKEDKLKGKTGRTK